MTTRREEWLRLVAAAMAGGARSPDDATERADWMLVEADKRFASSPGEERWPGPVQTVEDVKTTGGGR